MIRFSVLNAERNTKLMVIEAPHNVAQVRQSRVIHHPACQRRRLSVFRP